MNTTHSMVIAHCNRGAPHERLQGNVAHHGWSAREGQSLDIGGEVVDVLGDIGVARDNGNVSGIRVQQALVINLHGTDLAQHRAQQVIDCLPTAAAINSIFNNHIRSIIHSALLPIMQTGMWRLSAVQRLEI